MKNQIEEGFLDKIFGMIAKGRVDKVTKDMLKKDPKFAKAVKKASDAQNDLSAYLRQRYPEIDN